MNLRITGPPAEPFADLLSLSREELARRHAVRVIAEAPSSYPCRVSLTDAEPGDELLLVHYDHHAVASPYRSGFAIYVGEGEETCGRHQRGSGAAPPAHAVGARPTTATA